jgi:hypothetical protein
MYKFVFSALSIAAIIVFIGSLFIHKMIGVELIHSFQIIYITHLANNNYTEPYGMLKYLHLSAWNFYTSGPVESNLYLSI